jgi:DNA primase
MRAWLQSALSAGKEIPEAAEEYIRGRGMMEETQNRLNLAIWRTPEEPAPNPGFRKRYGAAGKWLRGMLVCPFYSPRGEVVGFEARAWDGPKKISDFRLPAGAWNPVFLGLTADVMDRIWSGCSVWVVEGLFDLTALERVVPSTDAVLATIRAKLSDGHVEFFRRFCRGMVNIVYDNDETGRKQTTGWVDETGRKRWGALDVLRRVGVECRDIRYIGGKDPGEIWEQTGTEGLRRSFAHVL